MLYAIWYHLHNLKNMKNTYEGVLLLVKLQASACYFTKSKTPALECFSRFLSCANDIPNCAMYHKHSNRSRATGSNI